MPNQKFSWKKRLRYTFDNFMSKGGWAIFFALLSGFFVAFALMGVIRYSAEMFFPNSYVSNSSDLLWEVFIQLIGMGDTGDGAHWSARVVGVITIFMGLIFFSSLVAFITQEFESRLALLRKGKSLVVETDHTLILGFSDRVLDILKELILANESKNYGAVVILSELDKDTMDDYLRNNLEDCKTTRIVTRNGSISNLSNLKKVGVETAKSIIILNDARKSASNPVKILADSRVTKAILAVVAANQGEVIPPIVVELHSSQYRELAETIAPESVTTLNEADILARILVQTSRNPGLANVYLNLVGFEGNEFYFYRPPQGWQQLTFGILPFRFAHGLPLGIRHQDGSLELGTSKDYQLLDSDDVIVLAEDDSMIEFQAQSVLQPQPINALDQPPKQPSTPETHLIIGWNNKTPIALTEYATYVCQGSHISVVVREITPDIQSTFDTIADTYPQITMEMRRVNVDSVSEIETLNPYNFDSISILAEAGTSAEEIDAKTLTILLKLRKIFRDYTNQNKKEVTTKLIAEIIDSEETDLVIQAGVKDFLLANQFVSKILAQVSQEPDVMSICQDLFSANGREFYLKPISLYFPHQALHHLTFADCILAAQLRDEICIGVRIASQMKDKQRNFGIDLIPPLYKSFTFTPNDALITLAKDKT